MKRFRLVDNIFGWLAFLIAAFVYCSTIEPTASFWDCPEFITTGYKLEIGHPPGAPFFMLTANLFSQFASDPTQVARMVNTMSALLSATCILFLFWSITHLTRKLLLKDWKDLNLTKLIAIEASGMVGALIYTFSDTFWFSAVEGEVYAYSSAFTAVVFWLILKWEDHADEPHSDRWLVLIMYMTGLSIGVHLLNLLCVPAIVLVYYFKKFPNAQLKGSLLALVVSFALIGIILYGVVPGIIKVGGWFELLFVNELGMPFNTGVIIYIILLVATVIWGIYETYTDRNFTRSNIAFVLSVAMLGIPFYGYGLMAACIGIIVSIILYLVVNIKKKNIPLVSARIKNTTLLCMLMLMIGYSTYAVIVIRSTANPPMDQNSPEDIFTLGSYLSRDQYGDSPLFYGQAYTSQVKWEQNGDYCYPEKTKGAPVYQRKEKANPNEKDSYFVVSTKDKYKYAQNMFFPRMHDSDHARDYESWMGGVKGYEVSYDRCGEPITVKMPTFFENMQFFLSYQCNFMYWRYFMWNFAGRQNDCQSQGEREHGNWITGFDWFDNWRLGDQSKLPDELKNNKGHNVFYCLPLLLGLIGFFWQAFKGDKGVKQFWVVAFLFFMTGLAIVLYLNQTPSQPRERDYAYAGSFYAFAIWCGLGVAAIIDMLQKKFNGGPVVATAIGVLALLVPVQMASQTWDDHDRSGRYTCRDFGQNYLMSLQDKGNPIIFTNGDNDTFPLWYNQETEGFRTDARVCNLSYLQTDWYIDQMVRPAYNSPSLPIKWSRLQYCSGTNEYIEVRPDLKAEIAAAYKDDPNGAKMTWGDDPFEIRNIMKHWVFNKDQEFHVIPTDTIYLKVDKDAVRRSGMMLPSDSIPDKMVISLKGKNALYKSDLMMLEIIANSNWTRPVYVATTVGQNNYMNLGDNFIQEGIANRITPFTTTDGNNFDTEKVYKNLMTRFKFGGLSTKGIYLDETVLRLCATHRKLFASLALHLIQNGDIKRAKLVLAKAEKEIPDYNVPMNFFTGGCEIASAYTLCGETAKGTAIAKKVFENSRQYAEFYLSLDRGGFNMSMNDCFMQLYIMNKCIEIPGIDNKTLSNMQRTLEFYSKRYTANGGVFPDME